MRHVEMKVIPSVHVNCLEYIFAKQRDGKDVSTAHTCAKADL